MNDPFQLYILPSGTWFYRTGGGVLAMHTKEYEYPAVSLHRTFPFSHSDRFLSVRNPKGEELGILESLDILDADSRQAVETELRLCYLTPHVTRIDKIKQTPGMWIWELQTTKGPIRLAMRNLHEHMQNPVPGRLLLSDLEGNRVEIVNYHELDRQSRKQLEHVL